MYSTCGMHYISAITNKYLRDINNDDYDEVDITDNCSDICEEDVYFLNYFKDFYQLDDINHIENFYRDDYPLYSELEGMSKEAICHARICNLSHVSSYETYIIRNNKLEEIDVLTEVLKSGYLTVPKSDTGKYMRKDQYPGVYMSINNYYNDRVFEPTPLVFETNDFSETKYSEDFTLLFSVSLMKNSNWHINTQQRYGELVGPFTYDSYTFPKYFNQIGNKNVGKAEIVFHDNISIKDAEIIVIANKYVEKYEDMIKKYAPHLIMLTNIEYEKMVTRFLCVKGLFVNNIYNKIPPNMCMNIHPGTGDDFDDPYGPYNSDSKIEYVFDNKKHSYTPTYYKKNNVYQKILLNCGYNNNEIAEILKNKPKEIEKYIKKRSFNEKRYPVIVHPPFINDDSI